MPFGPSCEYADFQECKDANRDRDDPDAYCAAIQRRTEGHCNMTNRVFDDEAVRDLLATVGRPGQRLARPLARQARPWYRISAKAEDPELEPAEGDDDKGEPTKVGDTTIIDIYDEIGWFGTGAQDFVKDLRGIKTSNIEVHLNSPGGDIFDAIAIYNGLRQHKAHVHMMIDSLAASSASFIAMAGDKITAMANATMMIHDPWGLVVGNAADMRDLADLLDRQGDNLASIYAGRAGGEVAEWRQRMLDETWYLADEAYAAGLVDVVDDADGRPVENSWDLSIFNRRPEPTFAVAASEPAEPATDKPTDVQHDARQKDAQPATAVNGDGSRRRQYLGETATWYLPHP